jgi:hypothetical protein
MTSFRGTALGLLVYVVLDFANPMMPGAFQLVSGTIETVDGCHVRGDGIPVPAAATLSRAIVPAPSAPEPAVRPSGPPVPGARLSRLLPRRQPASSAASSTSSPDDD